MPKIRFVHKNFARIIPVAFLLISTNTWSQEAGGHVDIDDLGTDDIETLQRQPEPEPVYVPPPPPQRPVYIPPSNYPSTPDYSPTGCDNSIFGVDWGDGNCDTNSESRPEPDPSLGWRGWKAHDWYKHGEGPCHVSKNMKKYYQGRLYKTSFDGVGDFGQQCQNFITQKKAALCPDRVGQFDHVSPASSNCLKAVEFIYLPCKLENKDDCDYVISWKDR